MDDFDQLEDEEDRKPTQAEPLAMIRAEQKRKSENQGAGPGGSVGEYKAVAGPSGAKPVKVPTVKVLRKNDNANGDVKPFIKVTLSAPVRRLPRSTCATLAQAR